MGFKVFSKKHKNLNKNIEVFLFAYIVWLVSNCYINFIELYIVNKKTKTEFVLVFNSFTLIRAAYRL